MFSDRRGLGPYLRYLLPPDRDDEATGGPIGRSGRRRRPPNRQAAEYPTSEAGAELMHRGSFGKTDACWGSHRAKKPAVSRRLMMRELGLSSTGSGKSLDPLIAQVWAGSPPPSPTIAGPYHPPVDGGSRLTSMKTLIPSSTADLIVNYDARCYSGQFSDDGNFFFCCAQDFRVRMYDTSNPYLWRYYKTVHYPGGAWTITDATLSPDNKFLAYSSIRSKVCLAPTDPGVDSEPWLLNFSTDNDRRSTWGDFGVSPVAARGPFSLGRSR